MVERESALERRLRDDARDIHAPVSAQLEARIRHALRRDRRSPQRNEFSWPLWLAASVSGAAVAVVALLAVGLEDSSFPSSRGATENPPEAVTYSVPEYVRELERQFPLRAQTADLTQPLDEELERLRADIERARETVEEDLRFTF